MTEDTSSEHPYDVSVDDLLAQYDILRPEHLAFSSKLSALVTDIVSGLPVSVLSVGARAKERESFGRKVAENHGKYGRADHVTDLSGVRVITYFEDDVDRVGQAIEREFDIDEENSVDRRALLDPDRFGYLSLHYVVKLPDKRTTLAEYQRFADLKAEIQVRSILQHAWAEIEHDLGYKSAIAVPRDIRRQFSRLAGTLELADLEFVRIRDGLRTYEAEVAARIETSPSEVLIDQASLTAYLASSPLVRSLGTRIAEILEGEFNEHLEVARVERHIAALEHFGITTIAELDKTLAELESLIVKMAKEFIAIRPDDLPPRHSGPHTARPNICLLYLSYILIARTGELEHAYRPLELLGFKNRTTIEKVGWPRIVRAYQAAMSGPGE